MSKKFFIDTPPPTVSGTLHMGHVFSYTQTDFIARYKRMCGFDVFYPIGFDDNGLPTERLVEKKRSIKGFEMAKNGQEEQFVEICKEIVAEEEINFENLFKSLNISFDFNLKYQTISDKSATIAQMSFLDLYHKGLIYKKLGPVYYDIVDKTALAQADLEDAEKDTKMCYLKFDIFQSNEKIEIMTTRPEMLESCLCVLFNENDSRFSHLEGRFAITPLGEKVPILKDCDVKIDKGTGLVMCCKYGDWQDVEWIRRHGKKLKNIPCAVNESGFIGGLGIKVARDTMIEKLTQSGHIFKIEETKHTVKVGERSKAPVEIIDTTQWYLNIVDFKHDFLKIADCLEFHPAHMKIKLTQWIEGISHDWCISRDRFFGIKIPDIDLSDVNISDLPIKENLNKSVFDTWFTSSVSPQLNTGFINQDYKLDDFITDGHPMDMRPQSHEIIRTWTFYTLVKSYLHGLTKLDLQDRASYVNKFGNSSESLDAWFEQRGFEKDVIINRFLPWKHVVLSGWCLASDKTKMSKSKGNILDPKDLITQNSTDVIRYWASCSNLGVDTSFNDVHFATAKRLINKLKNAVNFYKISSNDVNETDVNNVIYDVDLWILNKLSATINDYKKEFDSFEYCKAKDVLEKFFWGDFCDDYLELVKARSYGLNAEVYKNKTLNDDEKKQIIDGKASCVNAMFVVLNSTLEMLSPFIPQACVECFEALNDRKIKDTGFKLTNHDFNNKQNIDFVLEVLNFARLQKSNAKVSIKTPIKKIGFDFDIHENVKFDLFSCINAIDAEFLKSKDLFIEL